MIPRRWKSWMGSITMMSSSSRMLLSLFGLCAIKGVMGQVPCNICGEGGVIGKLFTFYNGKTCEDWKLLGESGNLPAPQCNNFAMRSTCECGTPSPTAAPTALVHLEAQLVILLVNVTHEMSPSIIKDFEEVMEIFYDTYFDEVSDWPGFVQSWSVVLYSQERWIIEDGEDRRRLEMLRRRLPAQLIPLYTRLNISARGSQSLGAEAFAAQLKNTTNNRRGELMDILKNADSIVASVHFKAVNDTEAFASDENVTIPRIKESHDPGTLAPDDPDGTGNDDDGMTNGTIAGIAAAAGFVIILTFGMWYVYCRAAKTKEKEVKLDEVRKSVRESQALRYSHATRNFEPTPAVMSMRESTAASTPQASTRGVEFASGSSASTSMTAANRYRSQRLGNLRSSSTRIVSADGKTLSVLSGESSREFSVSMRNKSLRASAISPESALPRDITGSYSPNTPKFQDEIVEGDEEDEEEYDEDNKNEQEGLLKAGSQHNGQTQEAGGQYEENVRDGSQQGESHQDQPEPEEQQPVKRISPPPQDRQEMPPPASAPPQVAQSASMGSAIQTREVVAPPGKLGIVIETTLEGPVVHKINANSPLRGMVFEGDLITAIDGIDCRAMSASAITALMVRTAESHRQMTIRSEH